jgi:hypothetical protein
MPPFKWRPSERSIYISEKEKFKASAIFRRKFKNPAIQDGEQPPARVMLRALRMTSS